MGLGLVDGFEGTVEGVGAVNKGETGGQSAKETKDDRFAGFGLAGP